MTSPFPEKLGRSSKSRTKSPCSPHAVGDTEADAEVFVAVDLVLTDSEDLLTVTDPEDELKAEVKSWLFVEMVLLESELVGAATGSLDDESEADDEVEFWPSATVVPLEEGS